MRKIPGPRLLGAVGCLATLGVAVGAPPPLGLPASVAFGAEPAGTVSVGRFVTVMNLTTDPLPLAAVAVQGPFRVLQDGCGGRTLAPAGICGIEVAFAPQGAGPEQGSLTVATGGTRESVPLSGQGE